jgi:hypothetical protein
MGRTNNQHKEDSNEIKGCLPVEEGLTMHDNTASKPKETRSTQNNQNNEK